MEVVYKILAVLGGTTVVIAALAAFFHNVIRDRLKQRWKTKGDLAVEKAKERGKIATIQPQIFVRNQYDVYVKLWRYLASLQQTVDALWQSATRSNILLLAERLEVAQKKTAAWSLFFEDRHLQQLSEAFGFLTRFHVGKTHLYDLRETNALDDIPDAFLQEAIEVQIKCNSDYKAQFESLLAEIRQSFQRKLAARPDLDD